MKPSVEKLYFGENPMDFGTFTLPESGWMGVVQWNFQRLGMKYNDKIKNSVFFRKLFFSMKKIEMKNRSSKNFEIFGKKVSFFFDHFFLENRYFFKIKSAANFKTKTYRDIKYVQNIAKWLCYSCKNCTEFRHFDWVMVLFWYLIPTRRIIN